VAATAVPAGGVVRVLPRERTRVVRDSIDVGSGLVAVADSQAARTRNYNY
jgi:hypothetical protein